VLAKKRKEEMPTTGEQSRFLLPYRKSIQNIPIVSNCRKILVVGKS
jgi:hypothetical protein